MNVKCHLEYGVHFLGLNVLSKTHLGKTKLVEVDPAIR